MVVRLFYLHKVVDAAQKRKHLYCVQDIKPGTKRVRRWRESLSDSQKAIIRDRENRRRVKNRQENEEALQRHRRQSREYYWRKKAMRPDWKPVVDKDVINKRKRHLYATDPVYNITAKLRARMRIALREQGIKKRSSSTRALLGISFAEFKNYLESQFVPGMTWENYGHNDSDGIKKWHIDHEKPCAAFNLLDPEEQHKCFHYSNMRPMWSSDNFSKNSTFNGIIIRKSNQGLDRPV